MKDRKISYIKVAAGCIANCWRAHPPLFIGFIIISALLCAVQVGEIFAMRYLFDTIAKYIGGNAFIFCDSIKKIAHCEYFADLDSAQ